MAVSYKKRIVDALLTEKLASKGAVLIEGPKWCGKTTTALQQAGSVLYLSDPKRLEMNMVLADTDPQTLLEGQTPRLMDEWQIAPKLWDAIRFEVDQRSQFGQFILTGSSVPPDRSEIHHTGTGRFSWLKMRPMSLMESGESNGSVSLGMLFSGTGTIFSENKLNLEDVCFLMCRGGWPMATYLKGKLALNQAFDYCDAIIHNDISRVDGVKRDPLRVENLMKSLARNQGQSVSDSLICADMKANDASFLSPDTVHSYITALKEIFVVEDVPSWNPNLRSKTAIRSSDTRYFVDPSIATASLGIGPGDLMFDLETCGLVFETLAIRDLHIYAEALDGSVSHYHDKNGLECDAVIHLRGGSYGLVEIKIGGDSAIEQGAKNLKKLSGLIDTTRMKKPSFLLVLTAVGSGAYRRPDGVCVVPIGCLGV